jgi:hypothetical protein
MKDFLLPFILISIPLLGLMLSKLKNNDGDDHEVDSLDHEGTLSLNNQRDNPFLTKHEKLREQELAEAKENAEMEEEMELSLKSYVADNKELINDLIDFIKHQGIYRSHEDYFAYPDYAIYELCFSKIDTDVPSIAPDSLQSFVYKKQVLEIKVEIIHPDSLKVFEIITYSKEDDMDYKKEYAKNWNQLSDATEYLFDYLRR